MSHPAKLKHIATRTVLWTPHPGHRTGQKISRLAKVTFVTTKTSLSNIRARVGLTTDDETAFTTFGIEEDFPVGLIEAVYTRELMENFERFPESTSQCISSCTADFIIGAILFAEALSNCPKHSPRT